MADDRWLSVDDVARYLGVKRFTVYRWIDQRGLPAHKRGKLWLFSKDEVDRWVRTGSGSGGDEPSQASEAAEMPGLLCMHRQIHGVPTSLHQEVDDTGPAPMLLSCTRVPAGNASARLSPDEVREHTDERRGLAAEPALPVLSGASEIAVLPESARAQVGVVMGLAVGVDMPIRIEALCLAGRGEVVPMGAVGRVMPESVSAAVRFIRQHLSDLGTTRAALALADVAVFAEIGDVPAQSDTLGAAVAAGLVSALTSTPLRRGTAVTGRVSADGSLLPVEDIAQRVHAAVRGGVREVFLPRENADEAKSLPFLRDWPMKVVSTGSVDEILQLASVRGQLDMFKMVGSQDNEA